MWYPGRQPTAATAWHADAHATARRLFGSTAAAGQRPYRLGGAVQLRNRWVPNAPACPGTRCGCPAAGRADQGAASAACGRLRQRPRQRGRRRAPAEQVQAAGRAALIQQWRQTVVAAAAEQPLQAAAAVAGISNAPERTCTSTSCAAGGVHSCWKRCRSPTSAAAGVPAAQWRQVMSVHAPPPQTASQGRAARRGGYALRGPPPPDAAPPAVPGLPARPLTVHCRHYLLPLLLPPRLLLPPVALSQRQLHQPAAAGEGCHAACGCCSSGGRGRRAGRAARREAVCVGGRAWARGRAVAGEHQLADRPQRPKAGWAPLIGPPAWQRASCRALHKGAMCGPGAAHSLWHPSNYCPSTLIPLHKHAGAGLAPALRLQAAEALSTTASTRRGSAAPIEQRASPPG